MEALCPPTPVARERSPATDLETMLLNWLPVGAVTEEDAASPDPSVDSAEGCFSCGELTHTTDQCRTLARRAFIDINTSIQLQMVRDRFIDGQAECALHGHLNSLGQNTQMADIADCCRVWERHCEVESTPRMSADRCPARAICQTTEDEPAPATSPETGNWEDIIRKLVPIPSDWEVLIQQLMEALCPPTPVARERSPATDLETMLLNWLPVGAVTEEFGLKININKTKLMVFRNGGPLRQNEKLYFDGKLVEPVTYYKYLGLIFSSRLSWSKTINTLRHQAEKAIIAVKIIFNKCGGLPTNVAFHLFDTLVLPILCYGSEIWGYVMRILKLYIGHFVNIYWVPVHRLQIRLS